MVGNKKAIKTFFRFLLLRHTHTNIAHEHRILVLGIGSLFYCDSLYSLQNDPTSSKGISTKNERQQCYSILLITDQCVLYRLANKSATHTEHIELSSERGKERNKERLKENDAEFRASEYEATKKICVTSISSMAVRIYFRARGCLLLSASDVCLRTEHRL